MCICGMCVRCACWVMLPLMYSWPAAHLCSAGWVGRRHPISDTLCSLCVSANNSTPFPFPLPSPPFPFLSESQPPATSLRRSESCLSSCEMGPAVCETTDMRYEKWEMREQTDTHAHSHVHTHTHRGIYSCIRDILGWISLEPDRSTCLSQCLLAVAAKRLCGKFTVHN